MNTFCVLPWYSKELMPQRTTPCCLLPKTHDLTQIKQDLLAGVKNEACATCWKLEEQGQRSRRQQENANLDYQLDRDLELIKKDCEQGRSEPVLYQITTSNLCNQACVTCNSFASSKWAEIERRMNLVPEDTFELNVENEINYATARRIELLGGEPLFDPKTFDILQKLLDHNNTDCLISLVTNGSIPLNDRMLSLLKQFTNINICVSIDGVGPVFEYMRWPAKWPVLLENLEQYRKIAKNLSVSYTISSVNIMYYNETISWFAKNNLKFNHNLVVFPAWASLDRMPLELKKITHNNFVQITGNEMPLTLWAERLKQQDEAKGIRLQDYLPEISAIVDNQ